ncbi:MAG: histidine phosphatase family protein [Planctomycetota bacterium]|nr:histidine phosphatase family protein [Planctomycetota bacterium]
MSARGKLRIQAAISSTLSRCRETLDLILRELPYSVERLADSSALNERSLGDFDGRRAEDVYTEFPQYRDDPNFNHTRLTGRGDPRLLSGGAPTPEPGLFM